MLADGGVLQLINLITIKNLTLHKAIEKLASNLPGSYSYIFDADERGFIYVSESNDLMEKAILELDQDQGLENLVNQSNEQTVSLNCSTTGRVFLIKRMAANLFFGLCVANDPETKQTALKVMASSFQVEDTDHLKV